MKRCDSETSAVDSTRKTKVARVQKTQEELLEFRTALAQCELEIEGELERYQAIQERRAKLRSDLLRVENLLRHAQAEQPLKLKSSISTKEDSENATIEVDPPPQVNQLSREEFLSTVCWDMWVKTSSLESWIRFTGFWKSIPARAGTEARTLPDETRTTLCPFQFFGVCVDDSCRYVHLIPRLDSGVRSIEDGSKDSSKDTLNRRILDTEAKSRAEQDLQVSEPPLPIEPSKIMELDSPNVPKKRVIETVAVSCHVHPLQMGTLPVSWRCDGEGCDASSTGPRYRCSTCDYDLCQNCMTKYDSSRASSTPGKQAKYDSSQASCTPAGFDSPQAAGKQATVAPLDVEIVPVPGLGRSDPTSPETDPEKTEQIEPEQVGGEVTATTAETESAGEPRYYEAWTQQSESARSEYLKSHLKDTPRWIAHSMKVARHSWADAAHILSNALDANPQDVSLWVVYQRLLKKHAPSEYVEMAGFAVQQCPNSFLLWGRFVESRDSFINKLSAVDSALAVFVPQNGAETLSHFKLSAWRELCLLKAVILCDAGQTERATGQLCEAAELLSRRCDGAEQVVVDAAQVLWIHAAVVAFHSMLPTSLASSIGMKNRLPVLHSWVDGDCVAGVSLLRRGWESLQQQANMVAANMVAVAPAPDFDRVLNDVLKESYDCQRAWTAQSCLVPPSPVVP